MRNSVFLGFFLLVLAFGCKDEVSPPQPPTPTTPTGSLLLKLEHLWGDSLGFATNQWFTHPETGDSLYFEQLRYYLSNFVMEDSLGNATPLPATIALVAGTGGLFLVSIPDVAVGDYRKISFDLGFTAQTLQQNANATFLDPLYGMYAGPDTGYLSVKCAGLSPASPSGRFQISLGGGAPTAPMHTRLSFVFTDGPLLLKAQEEAALEFDVDVAKIWASDMPLQQWYNITAHGQQCVRMLDNLGTAFKYRHRHD